MDYSAKKNRTIPLCLECGDKIRYGRSDKKFCSDDCRSRYNYSRSRKGKAFRRKIMKLLGDNYRILDALLKSDVGSADLMDLMSQGFTPSVMTSCHKHGKHDEYGCFDIKYIMTGTRIYSISKIQNL